VLPASLCAKIMVFRRITRIIEVVLNERAVTVCTAFMHNDLENMQKHHTFAPSKTKLTNEYKSDTYRHKVAVA